MAVIIDSTVWIKWFRNRIDPRPLLKPWILQGTCFSCGIIRIEVLRGFKDQRQKAKLDLLFGAIPEIPISNLLIQRATELAWKLDRAGKILPLGDLLIAQCAIDSGAWLVTEDKHFNVIAGVKVRKVLPKIEF